MVLNSSPISWWNSLNCFLSWALGEGLHPVSKTHKNTHGYPVPFPSHLIGLDGWMGISDLTKLYVYILITPLQCHWTLWHRSLHFQMKSVNNSIQYPDFHRSSRYRYLFCSSSRYASCLSHCWTSSLASHQSSATQMSGIFALGLLHLRELIKLFLIIHKPLYCIVATLGGYGW